MTNRLWETDKQFEPSDDKLKRFGYAPGHYMGKCTHCEATVYDIDKRASCCRNCAVGFWKKELQMSDHWLDDMLPEHEPADMPQPDWEDKFKHGGIQVFSGDAAWPLDMESTDINIEDIAHALAMKVRFTGHCTEQYSIAQHSCHVCELVPMEDKREALMHDVSEYVLPDVASPVKPYLPGFKQLEKQVEAVIAKRFDLRFPNPPSVKLADNAIVLFERTKIMKPAKYPWMVWTVPGEPANIPDFEVWGWWEAKQRFLEWAHQLGIK